MHYHFFIYNDWVETSFHYNVFLLVWILTALIHIYLVSDITTDIVSWIVFIFPDLFPGQFLFKTNGWGLLSIITASINMNSYCTRSYFPCIGYYCWNISSFIVFVISELMPVNFPTLNDWKVNRFHHIDLCWLDFLPHLFMFSLFGHHYSHPLLQPILSHVFLHCWLNLLSTIISNPLLSP